MNRRELLKGTACAVGASLLPSKALTSLLTIDERLFSFVHMTDLHIQPELGASRGVSLCVKRILELQTRPDFVIIGGDSVMDLLSVGRERADVQFKLLAEALKLLEMPIQYCVGNHDVYGWATTSPIDVHDPKYGKALWEEKVNQAKSYQSFDYKGWHFVILDTIMPRGERGWGSDVDDAQLSWLKNDLNAKASTPTICVSHVPLFTIFNQYDKGSTLPGSDKLTVRNSREVFQTFNPGQVKLVLQGHTHVLESCDYLGTRFLTAGSVCGEWWKGPRLKVHPEGFTVCDVYADRVSTSYHPYGWHAQTE